MQVSNFLKYFRYAGLAVEQEAPEHFRVTTEIVFSMRQMDYIGQWKKAIEEGWLHIRLSDQSFFLFSDAGEKCSYSYYACPLEIPTFQSFLTSQGLANSQKNRAENEDAYQLIIETAEVRDHFIPMRYDFDSSSYRKCTHPAGHIHVGLDNNIRIATRRRLTPLSFILMVIRQHYPENWDRLLTYSHELKIERRVRGDLDLIKEPHWSEEDEFQAYLQ